MFFGSGGKNHDRTLQIRSVQSKSSLSLLLKHQIYQIMFTFRFSLNIHQRFQTSRFREKQLEKEESLVVQEPMMSAAGAPPSEYFYSNYPQTADAPLSPNDLDIPQKETSGQVSEPAQDVVPDKDRSIFSNMPWKWNWSWKRESSFCL